MRREELEQQRALEARHFWFRARRRALTPWLRAAAAAAPPGPWLELGVGGGGNLPLFTQAAPERALIGVDPSPLALRFGRERHGALGALNADAERLPLAHASVAIATALDVLEHVRDDARALEELARCLAPGGRLIVTVPADPRLFGAHDRALGHRRRYVPHELETRLEESGFEVLEARGFNRALRGPVALWRRRLAPPAQSDVRPLPRSVNLALGAILGIEERLPTSWRNAPGLSWWIHARRRSPLESRLGRLESGA